MKFKAIAALVCSFSVLAVLALTHSQTNASNVDVTDAAASIETTDTKSVGTTNKSATGKTTASDEDLQQKITALKAELKGKFRSEPTSIKPSHLPNIFEVMYGTEVVYFSADGKYFLAGDMIELNTRRNISDVAKQSVRKQILDAQDNKPVVFKAKNEKHVLTVFTDIDCGFCAKLHREMAEINANGITVKYLMFPRAGIHSHSYEKAVSMWCADDQHQMMTDAKARKEIPNNQCKNHPIRDQYQLGRELGVNGTSTGVMLPGYMPADRLLATLEQSQAH